MDTEFVVVEEHGQALLGRQTSIDLGMLVINDISVNSVNVDIDKSSIQTKFPKCFDGLGKLKDYQLHIDIDKHIQPVVQGLRRFSYNLREKLEKKIEELVSMDIIEKVEGTSKWVSPIVVVPKSKM